MKVFFALLFSIYILSADTKIHLTNSEKEFINTHTIKCILTPNWAPFNTKINGHIAGIAVDYWQLIKQKLHIKSKCITTSEWINVLNAIKNKKADITLATSETKDRKKYAIFSKPYATFPIAIATRNDVGYIASMKFLKHKIIVVGKNYTAAKLLKERYPNYNILEVKNIQTALDMVSSGKAYAAIDIMPVLIYNINKYEFANLKISGKTPLEFKMQFMIRNDYTPLASAINKAIDTITPYDKEKIYGKWIYVKYQTGFSVEQVLTWAIIIGILITILFVYWIIRLKKEIKKRHKLEEELKKISFYDSLTDIYNRYKIDLSLKSQIELAKKYKIPLSIIFFDIDDFKKINDTYGHKVGDEVLIELSKLIKRNIRQTDIFGRWGGEEFIIILPNTDLTTATHIANKLKKAIEEHSFPIIKHLTCSFGVTELKDNDSLNTLTVRADSFLYEAKNKGKNRVISDLNV
ncbi:diguanylate cyclase [Nautilia profundicola AmH]|uniref:diguanylate cyclase n=1 Tax=Nautilia profundicola (strain ATCC BAA-1463 / DSM 18972 / AmH) TaxID=598659 RepID=B9L5Q2_NAUPA|nr:diguanylate cyclase [Nautilia profundicola]ACM92330.1 diguanylate cyclase [Nautilia profundicola AmH]